MVMSASFMTMSSRWSIATAKAELSQAVRQARHRPQIIENRGKPVAVLLGMDEYARLAEQETELSRWRAFLALSESLRAEGGAELDLPRRETRPSPFSRHRQR
jgi:prevent-host-death family protein